MRFARQGEDLLRGIASIVLVAVGLTSGIAMAAEAESTAGTANPSKSDTAQVTPSSSRLSLASDLYLRVNPAGAMVFVGPVFQHSYSLGPGILLRNLYVRTGVLAGLNPAYSQVSAFVESLPLAILQMKVQLDSFNFFGANGALLRFPSADSRFGAAEQKSLKGQETTGVGYRALLSPVLRARVGPVVARVQTDLAYYRMASESGYYLEWEYDTLVKRKDWVISNRAALLGVFWQGRGDEVLLLGLAHEVTHAVGTGVTRRRIELILYLEPATHWTVFDRPRLFGLVGVNLEDRNRANEPFGLIGAGADFDLWQTR